MIYNQIKPHPDLVDHIDAFWIVEGAGAQLQTASILPDGCVDLIFNLGEDCKTDNEILQSGKTYLVGTMTTVQQSFLDAQHELMGVRFKPAAFSSFYDYASLDEITNQTIEFEKALSPDMNQLKPDPVSYLNNYFLNSINKRRNYLFPVLKDIRMAMGQINISELAKRNAVTARQLERNFKKEIWDQSEGIYKHRAISVRPGKNKGQPT